MKSPFFLLLTVAGVLLAIEGHSQSSRERFSLNIGLSTIARQDQIFSPFIHSGSSFTNFGLTWERSKRLSQFLELQFSTIAAASSDPYDYSWHPDPEQFSTYPPNFTFLELNYGMGKSWQRGNGVIRAGGVLENNIQAFNYNAGPFSSFGYFITSSIAPQVGLTLPAGRRGVFDIALVAPLLSWTARSPYLVNDDEFIENTSNHNSLKTLVQFIGDGELQFPDQLQKLTFSARYLYDPGKRIDVGLAYRLQFIRHTDPLPLTSYQHQLCIQIGLKSAK
ncbi:MAG: hypothetical protein HUU01_17445 [Saprospiraceae bacterium]|nr:hypothetical protein [Saprospiraceae bacterium]